VETDRLKKLQEPSQTEKLLERLVKQAGLVPADAYQLRDPGAFPLTLQEVLSLARGEQEVSICWTDGIRI
jgi:hypothetical protein